MGSFSVTIRIPMKEKEVAVACKALESETEFKKKARIRLNKEREALVVEISSDDMSSLHAATGSMLRAIKVILAAGKAPKSRIDKE